MSKEKSKLKELREQAGLTQKQVAEKVKITYQSYQRYENKKIIPNAEIAVKIAKILETSVENLYDY